MKEARQQALESAIKVASDLIPNYKRDFLKLIRELLSNHERWGLFILEYEHKQQRERVIKAINTVFPTASRLNVNNDSYHDWLALEGALTQASRKNHLIHVTGLEKWLDPHDSLGLAETRVRAWNIRREAFSKTVSVPVLCWMRAPQVRLLATAAPDLWSWRAGLHQFTEEFDEANENSAIKSTNLELPFSEEIDTRTLQQRLSRIDEIKNYLHDHNEDNPLYPSLVSELANIYESIGNFSESLRIRREQELPIYERLGDEVARAVTLGEIADMLKMLGNTEEALRIHREEELPIYEKHDDIRSRAITLGQIADILSNRGELEEALRVHRDEELPVYEKLNDTRSYAVTLSQVANILQLRGERDEALRILHNKVLPVFEKSRDIRGRAITLGRIADILFANGNFDESLRIRREEELPVYEKLGDIRSKALTLGKIADVLQARGEIDEALLIYREEELPVYENLGDMHARIVVLGKIADALQARGDLSEALRIHLDERLPLAQQLQDMDSIAHIRHNCASIRLQQNNSKETLATALSESAEAFNLARRMNRTDFIASMGEQYGSLLLSMGQIKEATAVIEKAIDAFHKLEQHKRAQALGEKLRGIGYTPTKPH